MDIYWVGPRESDILHTNGLFDGSVTIYGDDKGDNRAFCNLSRRINHNSDNDKLVGFNKESLYDIIKNNPNAKFMFYDRGYARFYGNEVLKRTIGVLDITIQDALTDKSRARFLLKGITKTIPYTQIANEHLKKADLKEYQGFFPGASRFIIQNTLSSGGEGTFLVEDLSESMAMSDTTGQGASYIISPYIEGIPVNTHILIGNSDPVVFPPSVQINDEIDGRIIFLGSDFRCFDRFLKKNKDALFDNSIKVASFLKRMGYRGLAGVDWIISGNEIYFVEINPRYQASTPLINRALSDIGQPSIQEMEYKILTNVTQISICRGFIVPYCSLSILQGKSADDMIDVYSATHKTIETQLDGYIPGSSCKIDKDAYLGRIVLKDNITSVQNGHIFKHPFITAHKLYFDLLNRINDADSSIINHATLTKICLINLGVRLSSRAIKFFSKRGVILDAVFDALDLIIFENTYVNTPYMCGFSEFSPFLIDIDRDNPFLYFYDNMICKVDVFLLPNPLIGKYTSGGIPYSSIMQLSTDRIRINPAPVCVYKSSETACKFCNLPEDNYPYTFEDIKEVIDYCLDNISFRHFLIGGGTLSEKSGWEYIIDIASYIRGRCDYGIYLMSTPPKDMLILDELKAAGITDIALNIEIFDRILAKKLMPGKGSIPIRTYTDALQHAVDIWDDAGSVRSLLVYGFDEKERFIQGIEKLCRIGVQPVISIFRPLKGTPMEHFMPPNTYDLVDLFIKCKRIASEYGLELGPTCKHCRNNTLSEG